VGAPGKSVVVEGGKRGVLLGGKSAVYNAEESCPACCIEFTQEWSFTDQGFIDGGQGGAFRAYDDPADVPASPWTILNGGLGLRLDWEDDDNCRNHNPYTQSATATCEITVPKAMIVTVSWSGMGETEDPNYELMSLSVDGDLVGPIPRRRSRSRFSQGCTRCSSMPRPTTTCTTSARGISST